MCLRSKKSARKDAQAWNGARCMGSGPKRSRLRGRLGLRKKDGTTQGLREVKLACAATREAEERGKRCLWLREGQGPGSLDSRSRDPGYPGPGRRLGREMNQGFFVSLWSLVFAIQFPGRMGGLGWGKRR